MSYFSNIPKIQYEFPDGKILDAQVVFIRPEINIDLESSQSISKYVIGDGKSPDSLAKDIYSDSNLFYIILMTNKIFNFYKDWPTSYGSWVNELFMVNSQFTFYSRYNFDIQVNDLVCKYIPNSTVKFDKDNYGIVTDVNSFHRSFDVEMIVGDIQKGQNYIVMRKNGSSFKIINPTEQTEYQALIKKVEKLDSVFIFEKQDPFSAEFGPISPYYKLDDSIGDDSISDLVQSQDVILWKYMNDDLPTNVRIMSFKQNKENEWLFNKNITVVQKERVREFLDLITESIDEQKVIFE